MEIILAGAIAAAGQPVEVFHNYGFSSPVVIRQHEIFYLGDKREDEKVRGLPAKEKLEPWAFENKEVFA